MLKMMKIVVVLSILLGIAFGQYDLGLQNLGAEINNRVRTALAPLDNLGAEINRRVYEGLRPLRENLDNIANRIEMRSGIKGTTILTTENESYIIKNHIMYECSGKLSEMGECSEKLTEIDSSDPRLKCFSNNYATVNDQICIFSTGSSIIRVYNGEIHCSGTLMNINDYNRECGGPRSAYKYRFIADKNNPKRNNYPKNEHYPKCENSKPVGVCDFH